jgi:sterol desaturase/sphingolipid hydroxylase (fatty acid hydroxylase superfamily)
MPLTDRPRGVVLLAALALVIVEWVWRRWIARRNYDGRAALASFAVAVGHALTGVVNAAVISAAFALCWRATPLHLPMDDWRVWAGGFFFVELAYYGFHRWSHTVRWLWATHAVHHSAQELTLPAAVRLGWTGALSGAWLVFVPLVLAGFHPLMVGALLAFNLKYQFLLHTEMIGRLGVLEWVLNTPQHHRVHHAMNEACIDKNFGGVLIIFDRLFGTFAAAPAGEPLRYGLVGGSRTCNPFRIALGEYSRIWRDVRAAPGAMGKLRVLGGPP